MPAFVFKGKNREGKAISGERVADSKEAVMATLRREQIHRLRSLVEARWARS